MKKNLVVFLVLSIIFIGTGKVGTNSYANMMNSSSYNSNYSGSMMNNSYNQSNNVNNNNTIKLDIDVLKEKVNTFISNYEGSLVISDIFIYDDTDYYFSIMEKDTGRGAMELLVNPYTGIVYPEYGPNMMWNLKYSMMGYGRSNSYSSMMGYGRSNSYSNMMGYGRSNSYSNMMGYGRSNSYSSMMGYGRLNSYSSMNNYGRSNRYGSMMGYGSIFGYSGLNDFNKEIVVDNVLTKEDAFLKGTKYVDSEYSNAYTLEADGHSFYGYYTFHIDKDNKTVGMLSVNGVTGEVWFHNWHGDLTQTIETNN